MKKTTIILLACLCLPVIASAAHLHKEKWYQDQWCEEHGGQAGVVLILEDQRDRVYWLRLNSTIQHFKLPIDTWAIGAGAVN